MGWADRCRSAARLNGDAAESTPIRNCGQMLPPVDQSENPADAGAGAGLQLACAARNDYLPHCATMLASVLEHLGRPLQVHLLVGGDVSDRDASAIGEMLGRSGAGLSLHRLEESEFVGLVVTETFPTSHWYRVLLPEILDDVERVLYLDCDVIAAAPLEPLFDIDLGGRPLAAVTNVFPDRESGLRHCLALGLESDRQYFNSGVMLLDLARMRAAGSSRRALAYARENPARMILPEQDAINAIHGRDRLHLEPRWNALHALGLFPWSVDLFGAEALARAAADPALRHFEGSGTNKPWHPDADPAARDLYRRHRARTPWPELSDAPGSS